MSSVLATVSIAVAATGCALMLALAPPRPPDGTAAQAGPPAPNRDPDPSLTHDERCTTVTPSTPSRRCATRRTSSAATRALDGLIVALGITAAGAASARPPVDVGVRPLCVSAPGPALVCARGVSRAAATPAPRAVPPTAPAAAPQPARSRDAHERDRWRHVGLG